MKIKLPIRRPRERDRTPRLFECKTCEHKIRFGTERCGSCQAQAPALHRKSFWIILLLLPAVLLELAVFIYILQLFAVGA